MPRTYYGLPKAVLSHPYNCFPQGLMYIYIYMFVSLTRVWVVYLVQQVTSFRGGGGAEPIKMSAGNSLSSAKYCNNGNLCVQLFVHTPGSLLLLVCLLLIWRTRELGMLRVNEYMKVKFR